MFRPVIWLVILLIFAIFHKNKRARRRSLIAAFLVLIIFTNSFLVTQITKLWAVSPTKIGSHYDVGIVLGGSTVTYDNQYHRKIYKGNIDRLLQAVTLFEQGKIKKILITGGAANLVYKGVKEAKLLRSFLIEIKIPPDDILMDTLAENTHQNAVYSKQILQRYPNLKKYLLFTSSIHMRRAMACFKKEGISVTPYPTNLINSGKLWNVEYLLIPNISNFLIWDGMIHEMVGFVIYKIMGYV